jgi:hypothetical protein
METIMITIQKAGATILILGTLTGAAATQHAYEYRYGTGRYNYDVSGSWDRDFVSGNLDTNGK